MRSVTVVVIRSLSYTGTTWVNLLLADHPRAFAVGPPNRILDLLHAEAKGDGRDACRVHGVDCPLWPEFFEHYDPRGNFFLQLAKATGRDVIVINNPTAGGAAERHLRHPRILLKRVCVIRDGRSVVASYGRYKPDSDFLESIQNWYLPFATTLTQDQADPEVLFVRYEDVVADQRGFLDQAGAFLDLEYPANAHRFWEFDHHPPSGNPGPLATIARHQGRPFTGPDAEHLEARYTQLLADPDHPRSEPRWPTEWTDRDRLMFDYFAGKLNEQFGYPRDRFNTADVREFELELEEAPDVKLVYVPIVRSIRDALRPATLRLDGLHLIPRQVRTLSRLAIAFYVLSLLVVALACVMLF